VHRGLQEATLSWNMYLWHDFAGLFSILSVLIWWRDMFEEPFPLFPNVTEI
jgi:hypothetical protein